MNDHLIKMTLTDSDHTNNAVFKSPQKHVWDFSYCFRFHGLYSPQPFVGLCASYSQLQYSNYEFDTEVIMPDQFMKNTFLK